MAMDFVPYVRNILVTEQGCYTIPRNIKSQIPDIFYLEYDMQMMSRPIWWLYTS
jgi:hypothetical protein